MNPRNQMVVGIFCAFLLNGYQAYAQQQDTKSDKVVIRMVLGSTRQGRMADKVAEAFLKLIHERTDVRIELVDLRNYPMPFVESDVVPAKMEKHANPVVQRWADIIATSPALIFLAPEYNGGYPAVLKNALENLYAEFSGKPVGFIGYAGGRLGGTNAVAQLGLAAHELKMVPVKQTITIPSIWKALDSEDNFVDPNIKTNFNTMIDQLLAVLKSGETVQKR